MKPEEIQSAIEGSDLVAALDAKTRKAIIPKLVALAEPRAIDEGKMVWRAAADEQQRFAILVAGQLELGNDGTLFDLILPGQAFGYSALVPGRAHSARVSASVSSLLLFFDAGALRALMTVHQPLMYTVFQNLLELIAKLNRDISVGKRTVFEQVCHRLKWMCRSAPRILKIDQSTLASLAGCNIGGVEDTLRVLRLRGAVATGAGVIDVLDPSKLNGPMLPHERRRQR